MAWNVVIKGLQQLSTVLLKPTVEMTPNDNLEFLSSYLNSIDQIEGNFTN